VKRDDSNTWLEQDSNQVDKYLSTADVVLVERNRTHKILMDLFRYHFESPENLSILDLGCGDGILTKRIRERYPHNVFHLMDGSSDMLEKAKVNLSGDNISFRQLTFEEYIESPIEGQRYDFVHSANAIHHLDLDGKDKLFARIYGDMVRGGMFVNIDVVKPSSERSEQWQFRMWADWMNETLLRSGFKEDLGKYDHFPHVYKTMDENKPSTLSEQLDLLSTIGFQDVDCFFKYGIFAVFGGAKR
jgi:tRNA (cmo5U34)-methyltransferase